MTQARLKYWKDTLDREGQILMMTHESREFRIAEQIRSMRSVKVPARSALKRLEEFKARINPYWDVIQNDQDLTFDERSEALNEYLQLLDATTEMIRFRQAVSAHYSAYTVAEKQWYRPAIRPELQKAILAYADKWQLDELDQLGYNTEDWIRTRRSHTVIRHNDGSSSYSKAPISIPNATENGGAPLTEQDKSMNLTTATARTKAGYVGQVLSGGDIIWESEPVNDENFAEIARKLGWSEENIRDNDRDNSGIANQLAREKIEEVAVKLFEDSMSFLTDTDALMVVMPTDSVEQATVKLLARGGNRIQGLIDRYGVDSEQAQETIARWSNIIQMERAHKGSHNAVF